MQNHARILSFLLLAGLAASSFAFALSYVVSAWDTASNHIAARQITVTGEGKMAVKPDLAPLATGIIPQAVKIGEAQGQNSEKSNAVLAFLKQQGIPEKDIKTVGYAVSPQYQYFDTPCISFPCPPSRPPKITGYEVRHTVEVKIRDFTKTDAVLEGVVSAGANAVDALQFGVDDPDTAKAAARKDAIEDAEKKAKVLARDLHIRLTRIISFSESGQGGPIFPYALKGGFGGEAASSAPQVAPGEQEIRSFVSITYEFR